MSKSSKGGKKGKITEKDKDIEYFEISTEEYKKTRMERKTVKYEIKH